MNNLPFIKNQSIHRASKRKEVRKQNIFQHQNASIVLYQNSSSNSSTNSSSYASTDDNSVHNELRKISVDSISQHKPLDYKISAFKIEKDIRVIEPDKIDFPTVDSLPKWEGHDDEDVAESIILTLVARESLALNENGKYLKATTPPPGDIRESVLKKLEKEERINVKPFCWEQGAQLDSPIARQETLSQQELRTEPQNSQMEEKSEEIGGRLMRFREVWRAIGAERQVMMGMLLLWTVENIKQILKNISHPAHSRGIRHQFHLFLKQTPDGSYRKILDARAFNEQTKKIHFNMISPFDVQHALLKNSYLTPIDIKSAFSHIYIHPSLKPYLIFQVEDRSYIYIGMSFGLNLAPILLTKTLSMALENFRTVNKNPVKKLNRY
ncbi:MAG: hypothetical protein EZS28_004185 [Streblomastix strix]|uniref:Reverse transcriptase domain-containing protein n=1 Tax=Streblomastix strix TaxID=222440 RepID=A0A5J4WYV7_9EUKA|nr:MAG: hypothetical protein EZS28_004185 [Streblomastix strix]